MVCINVIIILLKMTNIMVNIIVIIMIIKTVQFSIGDTAGVGGGGLPH